MKRRWMALLLGWCFINGGGLMAETSSSKGHLEERERHFSEAFPEAPNHLRIDQPFENDSLAATLDFYSAPTSQGLFALALFSSLSESQELFDAASFRRFFEKQIAAYVFFDPFVFEQPQAFFFAWDAGRRGESASFYFDLEDQEGAKRLEGRLSRSGQNLCVAFYLADEGAFDRDSYERFISLLALPAHVETKDAL